MIKYNNKKTRFCYNFRNWENKIKKEINRGWIKNEDNLKQKKRKKLNKSVDDIIYYMLQLVYRKEVMY